MASPELRLCRGFSLAWQGARPAQRCRLDRTGGMGWALSRAHVQSLPSSPGAWCLPLPACCISGSALHLGVQTLALLSHTPEGAGKRGFLRGPLAHREGLPLGSACCPLVCPGPLSRCSVGMVIFITQQAWSVGAAVDSRHSLWAAEF